MEGNLLIFGNWFPSGLRGYIRQGQGIHKDLPIILLANRSQRTFDIGQICLYNSAPFP